MANSEFSGSNLSLRPLGAGDLIDRSVRFYRKNFSTFFRIAAPPVLASTLISLLWVAVGRSVFSTTVSDDPFANASYIIYIGLGNFLILMTEAVSMLSVMGGASRNFVRHILFGEEISFKETYRNTWQRLAGLIVANIILMVLFVISGLVVFYGGVLIGGMSLALIWIIFASIWPLAIVLTILISVAVVGGIFWLLFLIWSRFAYVPQAMLVEGRSISSAMSRSMSLASGNLRRFGALVSFSVIATYLALAILYVPLAWYASVQGVDIFSSDPDSVPAWYVISSQVISQASFIFLSPILMIGLCLLYVDERVRHEGYDIELMATRQLGEIPDVPQTYLNPLQPAIAAAGFVAAPAIIRDDFPHISRRKSTLGLD